MQFAGRHAISCQPSSLHDGFESHSVKIPLPGELSLLLHIYYIKVLDFSCMQLHLSLKAPTCLYLPVNQTKRKPRLRICSTQSSLHTQRLVRCYVKPSPMLSQLAAAKFYWTGACWQVSHLIAVRHNTITQYNYTIQLLLIAVNTITPFSLSMEVVLSV